jgi:His-Xaa-Ser system radical SAM maturase HxsC
MKLSTAGVSRRFGNPIVARVSTIPVPLDERRDTALVQSSLDPDGDYRGYAAIVVRDKVEVSINTPLVHSVQNIDQFVSGHVIVLEPLNGFIRILYRPESPHNTLLVTERCNSNCLMCSQPPKDKDDIPALTERNLKLIDLMSPAPEYVCITGGEPTLLGDYLFAILNRMRDKMPSTHVHMLTNGRRFAWSEFTSAFSKVHPSRFSVGIPLYADSASLHDYIVQAANAFDQTVLGLHQLARYGIETEIRVVLHSLSIPRLSRLAEYICRNLTFVDHVAFMGMEHIGYAPRNMDELWIDPLDYQEELEKSIAILTRFGIDVRIYNLQLCVLKRSLWKYSSQAISDWKNAYRDVCEACAVRGRCGGFFQWSTKKESRGIHPIAES